MIQCEINETLWHFITYNWKKKPGLDLWWETYPRIPPECAQNTDSGVKSSSVGTRGARWQLFLHDMYIFIQWWKLSTKYAGNIQKPTVYFVLILEVYEFQQHYLLWIQVQEIKEYITVWLINAVVFSKRLYSLIF